MRLLLNCSTVAFISSAERALRRERFSLFLFVILKKSQTVINFLQICEGKMII